MRLLFNVYTNYLLFYSSYETVAMEAEVEGTNEENTGSDTESSGSGSMNSAELEDNKGIGKVR